MKLIVALSTCLLAAIPSTLAAGPWQQCGGQGYSGSTECDPGYACIYQSSHYFQCLRLGYPPSPSSTLITSETPTCTASYVTVTVVPTTTSTTTTSTSSTPSTTPYTCPNATKFKYYGVNQSCAEFGSAIPGILDTTYTWPSPSSIDFFLSKGMNLFRIPFKMERLSPLATGLTGPFDPAYLSGLKTTVAYITSRGGYAAIDPHNYARYNNSIITDTAAFETWQKNLALEFLDDPNVIFDLNNEPWGIPATQAAELMQAGINGVRSAGATQLIFVQGTSWTGAWTWVSSGNAAAFENIYDPLNNTILEMHQYLDSDGSGTSATCVSPTVGVERLTVATNWLLAHGVKGFLGEIGAGSNDDCITAVRDAFCYMQQSGAWVGVAWWAAGPWWGNYFQSIEPPSGPAIARMLPEAILPFV